MNKKSPMDNLKILLAVIAIAAAGILFFFGASRLFLSAIYNPGTASLIIFIVFLIVLFFHNSRAGWSYHGMLIICITAFAGCIFDGGGNLFYNKPIQWLFQNMGQLEVINTTSRYGSEYYVSYLFQIVSPEGSVIKIINNTSILVFRFFEYLAIYSILLTVLMPLMSKIRKKPVYQKENGPQEQIWEGYEEKTALEIEKRKLQASDSRKLNPEVEKEIRSAMERGETVYAIKLVKIHTSLGIGEAKELVEKYKK